MIVVDASVAVKWFLKEPYSEEAVALLTCEQKLVGPQLAAYEVAGAFTRALRRDAIDKNMCIAIGDRWIQTIKSNVMQLSFDHADIARANDIAIKLKHPLADCTYLAMAERLEAVLVTADDVFYKKAKKSFTAITFIANVADLMPQVALTS